MLCSRCGRKAYRTHRTGLCYLCRRASRCNACGLLSPALVGANGWCILCLDAIRAGRDAHPSGKLVPVDAAAEKARVARLAELADKGLPLFPARRDDFG